MRTATSVVVPAAAWAALARGGGRPPRTTGGWPGTGESAMTRSRGGAATAAADPGDLPALRDQAAGRVPDLGLLVEPAAADVPGPGRQPQQPGRWHRAHVPGEFHGRRPARTNDAEDHRGQRVHRERQQISVGQALLT